MADESGQDRIHHPVWDPPWLRALYTRCLWDGGERTSGLEFCSESCWEMYANWEPVPGRHDERVAVLPVRTPRRRRPPQ